MRINLVLFLLHVIAGKVAPCAEDDCFDEGCQDDEALLVAGCAV
jgi:hypothetical protein